MKEKKDQFIIIRVTKSEKRNLEKQAKSFKQKMTDFVRAQLQLK